MKCGPDQGADPGLLAFVHRILLILLLGALALAAWRLIDVALLLFGAILMAIGLRGVTQWFSRATRIGEPLSLATVVIVLVVAVGLALWFFGTVIGGQFEELAQQIPAGLRAAADRLRSHPYGRYALEQAQDLGMAGISGWLGSALAIAARAMARGIGYGILLFFVAIYLAAQPDLYRRMCLRLVPRSARCSIDRLFTETADILRRWLLGQLVVMATIGTLSGIGLWALGIEAAFALGLVGGFLTFIPYVGAVLAAVPATLVALTQGLGYAAAVILMYVATHFVEGNFITPVVQAEATALPPVLSLLSTVAFSILFGPTAVLLATPLTLFLMIVVDILYVEQALGEPTSLRGMPTDEGRS
jgi:predicted PurR-regulated permease PerM